MAAADYRVMTDATGQTLGKDATLQTLAKDSTLGDTNTALGLLGKDASLQDIKAAILALPNATQQAANNANAAAANANNLGKNIGIAYGYEAANLVPFYADEWEQINAYNFITKKKFENKNSTLYFGALFSDAWSGTGGFVLRYYNASDVNNHSVWYYKSQEGTIRAENIYDEYPDSTYFKIEINTNESSVAISPADFIQKINAYVSYEKIDDLKQVYSPSTSIRDLIQDFSVYTSQNLYTPYPSEWVKGTAYISSATYACIFGTHFPIVDKTLYMACKMLGDWAEVNGGCVVRVYDSSDNVIGDIWCNNGKTREINLYTEYPHAAYFRIEVNTNDSDVALGKLQLRQATWIYIGYDKVKSIADIVPQTVYGGSLVDVEQNSRLDKAEEDIDVVPDFYMDYVDNRIKTINNRDVAIGNHGDSFIFITDLHDQNRYYSPKIAKRIIRKSSIRDLVYGGDYINEPNTKQKAIDALTERRAKCSTEKDVIFVRGNHDTNAYGGTGANLTTEEYYGIFDKQIEKFINTDGKTYFYRDNDIQKIRYFFMDSGVNGTIDATQQSWMAAKVAEIDSSWKIVVFVHHGIYTNERDDRTNIQDYGSLTTIKGILAEAAAKVCCVICGHVHIDISDTTGDYPIIATTCDAHGIQASEYSTDNRTEGTINEQAFDVFHIDTNAKKIYVTRIGGGQYNVMTGSDLTLNDREFSYT